MAKLVTVIVLNRTQVSDAFVRRSLLMYCREYPGGRRSRRSQRSRRSTNWHCLWSLCRGLSRRGAEGYSITFRALLLLSSYSDLLINSRVILYKGS
jgi:hypothetical protein